MRCNYLSNVDENTLTRPRCGRLTFAFNGAPPLARPLERAVRPLRQRALTDEFSSARYGLSPATQRNTFSYRTLPSGRVWARSACAYTARTAASPLCAMAAWFTPALAFARHDTSVLEKTKGQATSPSFTTRSPACFSTAANAPGCDNAPGCGGDAPGGGGGMSGPRAGITAVRNWQRSGGPQAVTTTRPPGRSTRTSSRIALSMCAA